MVAVPRVDVEQAEEIARAHYGVSGRAERLAAEHDDTFRLTTRDGAVRLLKIGQADDAAGGAAGQVSFQTGVLLHLAATAPQLPVQRVTTALGGAPEARIDDGRGHLRIVRMTSWLEGEPLGRAASGPALRCDLGATLARLDAALRGWHHPGARRTHPWDLQNFGRLRALLDELPGDGLLPEVAAEAGGDGQGVRAALTGALDRFDAIVRPRLAQSALQVIHTDFHGDNLLTDGGRITGILDFGDALAGPVAMDLGVAACYQLGAEPDVLGPALDVVAGYHEVSPLTAGDLDLTAEFIVARVAARVIVSQWNAVREPANRGYLLRRTPQAVGHLAALRRLAADEIACALRDACAKPAEREVAQ